MTYPTKEHALPSDPHSFDEIKLPFIFVPHGAPEPTEWLQRHPDTIKLPATFVPHARGEGRAALSSGDPPPGQHGSANGFAAASDSTVPQPQAGDGMSSEMSAAAHQTADRAAGSNDPVAAFRRANAGLATAASDHTAGRTDGLDSYAYVGNDQLNGVVPSGLLSSQAVADYLNGSANQMDIASACFVAQPVIPFKLLGPVYVGSSLLFKSIASYIQPDPTGTVMDATADVVADSLPIPGMMKPLASQGLSIVGNRLVSLGDSVVSNISAGNQAPTTGLYINPSVLTDPTSLTGAQRPLSVDGGGS
jgi:hypothetical protein